MAILGFALETRERNVDLPTLGKPTSPTSAITLSSRRTVSSLASCPGCAYLGTCMVGVAYHLLPLPPLPPFKMTSRSLPLLMSAITLPDTSSYITVPSGTLMIRSAPSLPWHNALPPSAPLSATYFLICLNSFRVLSPLSTSNIMSPPLPPSPPSGPPAATKSSRLKLTWPSPPLPDLIKIVALSANI